MLGLPDWLVSGIIIGIGAIIWRLAGQLLFGRKKQVITPPPVQQALIVNFKQQTNNSDAFYELIDELYAAFERKEPYEYDGHDIAIDGSEGNFYFYGPDAGKLLILASPILLKYKFMAGAECLRRYGDVNDTDAQEVTTVLGQLPS